MNITLMIVCFFFGFFSMLGLLWFLVCNHEKPTECRINKEIQKAFIKYEVKK